MCRLGSVPEAQLDKKRANRTIRTKVTTPLKFWYLSVMFFNKFLFSGISRVRTGNKGHLLDKTRNKLELGTQAEF